jgi:transcriptional regulator with XRE-family HTH domain
VAAARIGCGDPYAGAVTDQLSDAVRLLIEKLLAARGMKRSELAAASGLPPTSVIRKLKENEPGRFDLDDVAAIAPVFGLSASDLISWAERTLRSEG